MALMMQPPPPPRPSAPAGRFLRPQMPLSARFCSLPPTAMPRLDSWLSPPGEKSPPDPDGDTSVSPLLCQAKLEGLKRKCTGKWRHVAEAGRKSKKRPWPGNGMFTGHKFGPGGREPKHRKGQEARAGLQAWAAHDWRSTACPAASLDSSCRPTHLLCVTPPSRTRLWGSAPRSIPSGDPHLPHAGPAPAGLGLRQGCPSAQHSGWYARAVQRLAG